MTQKLGRYEIVKELGRGAMGAVFLARDPVIDRTVAIKTILASGMDSGAEQEGFRARFFREAQAAGKLSHPGIVTIHDVGEDEATRTPYIVMEFIEGRTLDDVAEEFTGVPPAETTLDLMKQVAEALDYAHAQGIVHRDIKPANILVTRAGRAKIADFGVARIRMAQMTVAGQVFGTPSYMAPEQFEGGRADGRSDLFSLGVILYGMLTGLKPFVGEDLSQVMYQVVYKEPPPATQGNPRLSAPFDYVCARALAKAPERRYQTGREFGDDVEDLRAGRAPRSQTDAPRLAQEAAEKTVAAPPRERRSEPPLEKTLPIEAEGHSGTLPARSPVITIDWVQVREKADAAGRKTQRAGRFVWKYTKVAGRFVWKQTARFVAWLWRHTAAFARKLPGRTRTAIAWSRRTWGKFRSLPGKAQFAIVGAALVLVAGLAVWWLTFGFAPKTDLSLSFRHDLREGRLVVEVDGREIADQEFAGAEARRLGVLRRVEGSFSTVLRVPIGQRKVRVRVVSMQEEFDQTGEIEVEFAPGMEKGLIVTCESRRGSLTLSLR